MIALIAFCLLSQEIKPVDVKAMVAKAEGATKTEKALNGVEQVCKKVLIDIQESQSRLTKETDKKKAEETFEDLAKAFDLARKDQKPESYSNAIGKMSFYFRAVVRVIPGPKYYGSKSESLRNACFEAMDEARK